MFISASILEGFVPLNQHEALTSCFWVFDAAVVMALDFVLLFVVVTLSRSQLSELQLACVWCICWLYYGNQLCALCVSSCWDVLHPAVSCCFMQLAMLLVGCVSSLLKLAGITIRVLNLLDLVGSSYLSSLLLQGVLFISFAMLLFSSWWKQLSAVSSSAFPHSCLQQRSLMEQGYCMSCVLGKSFRLLVY